MGEGGLAPLFLGKLSQSRHRVFYLSASLRFVSPGCFFCLPSCSLIENTAAVCADSDLLRMAQRVSDDSRRQPRIMYLGDKRSSCSHATVKVVEHNATKAILLDVDGLHRVLHMTRRCRARGRAFKGKRLWTNFVCNMKTHTRGSVREELAGDDHDVHSVSRNGATRRCTIAERGTSRP